MARLEIWVPTNRADKSMRWTHVDGWNELKSAFEVSRAVGATRIRQNVKHVARWTAIAMRSQGWPAMSKESAVPCKVTLTFVEKDRRRDVGNIHGGAKYALDALTARHDHGASAIYDDSQRWLPEVVYQVAYVGDEFKEPGIQILVETLEDR